MLRMDAIGDYVLFRNFIAQLAENEGYINESITLIGNSAWMPIAEKLDAEYIDNFIWLDRTRLFSDAHYRRKKLREITDGEYDTVVHSTYSRDPLSDLLVWCLKADRKIGSIGDRSNIKGWAKSVADGFYTELVAVRDGIMFEFVRNREFFATLLGSQMNISAPSISLSEDAPEFVPRGQYAILFVGADAPFRKWNPRKYAEIGSLLQRRYGYQLVLCGGKNDYAESLEFATHFRGSYTDLVGKTSLSDLLYIIRDSEMIVSNETSVPHIAVALGVQSIFVISNGNHFGRFTPYPEYIATNYHPIYHPLIEDNTGRDSELRGKYGYGSSLAIDDITPEQVMDKIGEVLG